ncbi:MAG: BrnA antitoxin family protein [Acidiferrobacter sp.]
MVYAYPKPDVSRIISVRKAEPHKRRNYEECVMKARYNFSKARRGAVVPSAPTKTRITIRQDEDILAWFRNQANEAGGGNYQSLINEALREYIG